MGITQEAALGFPGYTGRIPKSAAKLARILRDTGYNTIAVGKWHLAPQDEYSAAGPFDRWPLGQGFERYYGFLGAETSQWAPELVRDNTHIDPPYTPEEGYHLTEDLADQAIRMIQDQQQAESRKPFFCYLATGAAHAPHQVTEEWVEPYVGQFDDGWEAWRQRAYDRQVAEGIVPADTVLTERPPWVPDWETLPADERRLFARYMEVFAGFVTHTDHHLGRLFDYLEERGIAEDTIVMVLSDNGASAEGGPTGTLNEAAGWLGLGEDVEEAIARIDEIGGHDAYNHYPYGWAWAGNAPLRLWKRYAWLGGVRTPLVVRWGDRLADRGGVRPQFCHAVDLYATVLDAAGIAPPGTVDGVTQQPVDGASLLPSFAEPGGRRAPAGAVLRDVRLARRSTTTAGRRSPTTSPTSSTSARTSSAASTTTPTGGRSSTSPTTSPSRATSPTSSPTGSAGSRSCGGPRPGATRCCRCSSSRARWPTCTRASSRRRRRVATRRAAARSRRASCRR